MLKLGTSSPIRKIQRWTLEIGQYWYIVRHCKGTSHVNVDALSHLVGELPPDFSVNSIKEFDYNNIFYMEDVGDLACC